MGRVLLVFICVWLTTWCKGEIVLGPIDSLTSQIETYILTNKIDSAKFLLQSVPKEEYTTELEVAYRLVYAEKKTEQDMFNLLQSVLKKGKFDIETSHHFLEQQLGSPYIGMSRDYLDLRMYQIMFLFNNDKSTEAAERFNELDKVVQQLEPSSQEYKYARFKLNRYHSIVALIKRDVEEGERIYKENLSLIEELGNNTAYVLEAKYSYFHFFKVKREIEEYVRFGEEMLELDKTLDEHFFHYKHVMFGLIDAYVHLVRFKKDTVSLNKIPVLLDQLYASNEINTQIYSYQYYMKYLGILDLESEEAKRIYKKFGVGSLLELNDYIIESTRPFVSDLGYMNVLQANASALEQHGYFKEASAVKSKAITVLKSTYSRDLAESIAKHDIEVLEQKTKHEIEVLTLESRILILIAVFCIVLAIIAVWGIRLQKINNRILKKRNKEKELLLKEIHHRIKNNFQLATSLLNIQFRNMEDPHIDKIVQQWNLRVKSMIAVHQNLYQNDDSSLELKEYITGLLHHFKIIYDGIHLTYTLKIDKDLVLDIDTAMRLGLVLNELINNAFKHGNQIDKLSIDIECKKEGASYKLSFSDSGQKDISMFTNPKTNTFGIRLVNSLVNELKGSLDLETNSGEQKIVIQFKDKHQ